MRTEVQDFLKTYVDFNSESRLTCYITRDSKFLRKLLTSIHQIENKTNALKNSAIENQYEEEANLLLAIEYYTRALADETNMLLTLKDGDPNEAWNFLVSAREHTEMSLAAFKLNEVDQLAYLSKLIESEKIFFPPQSFQSPTFLVERIDCSICRREYKQCGHIFGRPYMGQLCLKSGTIKEFLNITVVSHPVDRRRRIISMGDKQDVMRDVMTWKIHREQYDPKAKTTSIKRLL